VIPSESVGIDERIILKWTLKNKIGGVGGLIWLRLGVNVGLFVLLNMQGIYYPAQELHTSLKMGFALFVWVFFYITWAAQCSHAMYNAFCQVDFHKCRLQCVLLQVLFVF
jgi:hypothetical protein